MKTKVIASIGPKSRNYKTIYSLIKNGAEIFRFNFSHATKKEFEEGIELVKKASKDLKKEVRIMQDLQGPRIRLGKIPEEGMELKEGKTYEFAFHKETDLKKGIIDIDNPYLHADIKKGDPFFIIGGEIQLEVTKVKNESIFAKTIIGGVIYSHKGINIPKTSLSQGGLTSKDIKDAKFALPFNLDYIALSFVQDEKDIERLRKIIGKKKTKIIAKIERALALKNIDKIIQASDGIMVARGDLSIEIPFEDVPVIQKHLIRQAHWHKKPVIVATQMMTSMINHPNPTRAEVNDIASAVFDRADAVMLSDETAMGDYPEKAVAIMDKVIRKTEEYIHKPNFFNK